MGLILALCMLSAFVPIIHAAETGTQYGDYLYYKVNDDNTAVTITDCDESATEIVIPSEINGLPVTSIGDYAFCNCSSLESIEIPDSVTSIGSSSAFYNCSSLTSIDVSSNNSTYSSSDGVVFNKDKTELICCPDGKSGSYTIPDSVTSIGVSAFGYCNSLTSIVIPDSVTSIGAHAFSDCSSLTSIEIPDSVTSIVVVKEGRRNRIKSRFLRQYQTML